MPIFLRWLLRLGPTNPIAVRLVQNGSRRRKHMYVRSAYLAVLIVVLLWALLLSVTGDSLSYRRMAAAGAQSFVWIAYLQIALICILAPVFMAGAIAQESDPKTWDILLTTPLGQHEIVLGNLFGRLFFILALLFCSLPLFAITQYFGGVPGRAIFASYLIAGAAATLVGAIAIALSVSRLAGRRAVFTFYVAVITYLGVTWAVDAWLRGAGHGALDGTGVTPITALNPFLSLHAMLNPSTYPRAETGTYTGIMALLLERPVTSWVMLSLGLSAVLMGLSTLTVRLGGFTSVGRSRSGVPWYRKIMGLGASGSEFRPPRTVSANPISWRESTARNATFGRIAARWSFLALGAIGAIVLVAFYHTGQLPVDDYRFILSAVVWTEIAVITLVAINMAASAISREREDGTLDLILTTPITPGMYLTGKLRGLVMYLVPLILVPSFTVGVAGLHTLIGQLAGWSNATQQVRTTGGAWGGGGGTTVDIPVVLPEAGLLALVAFTAFIAFCVMIGLQWSLKSKGSTASVIGTVAVVGAIGGTLGLCAWNATGGLELVGPALAGLSPASVVHAIVTPESGMAATIDSQGEGGLSAGRVAMAIGVLAGAGVYAGVIAGIHASMKRNFDFTVRKLAGTR